MDEARSRETAGLREKDRGPGGGGAQQPSQPFCPRPTSVFSSRTPPPSGASFGRPRVPRGTDGAERCCHWSVANVPALLPGPPSAPARPRRRVAHASSLPTRSPPPRALSDRGLPRAGSRRPALPFPPGRSESGGERESSRTLRSCVTARWGGEEAGPRRAFRVLIRAGGSTRSPIGQGAMIGSGMGRNPSGRF